MKTIWKGTLSFGLVTIPIKLYSAIQHHAIGFKLLHARCKTPINYQRWCAHCKQQVLWEDIVKGIPLADDTFFVINQENLKKLKPEKTDAIAIIEFVDKNTIPPIYFDEHYYIIPAKETDKAYFLFIKALTELNKAAIGQFVLKDKENICAISPYEQGLLLSTLNYAYEIRASKELEALQPPSKFSTQELTLAKQLITKLSKKRFDIAKFKDTFVEKLKDRLKKVTKGINIPKAKKLEKTEALTGSLIAALQASLSKQPAKQRNR